MAFPRDLVDSFECHDGDDDMGFAGNWDLLSLHDAQRIAKHMNTMAENGEFDDARPAHHPRIRRTWWHRAWLPIVSSATGHHFCVDLDPAPGGQRGQVFIFLHDDGKRLLVADSVLEWLSAIARDLERGRYIYEDEEWKTARGDTSVAGFRPTSRRSA